MQCREEDMSEPNASVDLSQEQMFYAIKPGESGLKPSITTAEVDRSHSRKCSADVLSGESVQLRSIHLGAVASPSARSFPTNKVRTAKYNLLTWAPKSLFTQFYRTANVYFLVISILSAQYFSPKTPLSIIGTFAAVLFFTMLKEAYEDWGRHKSDRKVNRTQTQRLDRDTRTFRRVQTQEIRVGDIVKVEDDESFPADLLLLSCQDSKGLSFVNTMNLDGETNLKERLAFERTKSAQSGETLSALELEIQCDQPNASLVRWNCNVKVNEEWLPVSMTQLLLRGCVLKNSGWVFGVVIYTGHETKSMLNSKEAPSKMSHVLRLMNRMLYTVFLFQVSLCLLFAGLSVNWKNNNASKHDYLNIGTEPDEEIYFIQVLTFLVAYSHLIPISLYVALEVVKLALAYLIAQDLEMYYELDNRPASCRTSDLVEELGQVSFIFSDKTGTLTQNVMEFKKCSIGNQVFGGGERADGLRGVAGDPRPYQIIENRAKSDPLRQEIEQFFLSLALCHSVFPTELPAHPGCYKYQSTSPDELALVQGSADMGFLLCGKEDNLLKIKVRSGEVQTWEVMAEIAFTSERRRMSVVVKEVDGEKIRLITKGADSVLFPLLEEKQDLTSTELHINDFAKEGLRTLVISYRDLSHSEFSQWFTGWQSLLLSTRPDKSELQAAYGARLEVDLTLSGITAIEDKLQDGVPEAIECLMDAGIRLWVLTGDKQETALQIAKACKLIRPACEVIDLSSDSYDEFKGKLDQQNSRFRLQNDRKTLIETKDSLQNMGRQVAVVIDGATLLWALDNTEHRSVFFNLGFLSNSFICCRVSPAQKMQVVKLAKEQGPWITLAIGDGANDVSMIQEAHIGIGIAGKEGSQAVQSSDYAFSQFRYLTRLLLVHGRWGYRRISWFICYYFYKNIAVVFAELWFAVFNGFSGQIYFADWLPQLYNSFWTSWPCMFTFIFEQDLDATTSLRYPVAYAAGQRNLYFNFRRFWMWIGLAVYHGALCYWVPFVGLADPVEDDGKNHGLWWTSTLSFTLIIHIVTLKLYLESAYWTKVSLLAGFCSVLFYYLTVIVLNAPKVASVFQPQLTYIFFRVLGTGKAWIAIFFTPIVALLPDIAILFRRTLLHPTPIDKLRRLHPPSPPLISKSLH